MLHNLSLSMLSQDCEPYVFAPYVRGKDNRMRVPYKILRYSRPSSRRFGLRQLLIPLLWHHLRYRFDILHCGDVYPAGWVGASFHSITGVPLVITPHGGDLDRNSDGYVISRRVADRIRRTFTSAQVITAISINVKQRILELGGPRQNICIVPNGVFTDEFRPIGPSGKGDYILSLGRLVRLKGIDILIKAYCLLKKTCPAVKLKIAGDGVEMHALKELADSLNLSEEIEFLGTVRGEEKIRLLSKALLFVCPSREEAFGIGNLEALASGLPVIASRVGGIPDVIEDGINGFLIEPEKPDQLAERMRLLIEDHTLRQQMVEKALHSAVWFDWSRIVQDYLRIYRDISH